MAREDGNRHDGSGLEDHDETEKDGDERADGDTRG